MAEDDPMTKGECANARAGCKEIRSLEAQNFVLSVRAEVKAMFEEGSRRIDARFDAFLREHGYATAAPEDETAVHANRGDHPARREKDETLRARAGAWLVKNAAWCMAVVLALIAGKELYPYATRIAEAVTTALEALLK